MNPTKLLDLPDEIYNVNKKVYIEAPPEKVFEALTDSKHWDRYFTTGMELDARPGGACNFKWKNWGPDLLDHESPGRVVSIDPPRSFVFEWGQPGEETVARLELEPKATGTILSLFEDGYPKNSRGLHSILECSAHWGELLTLIKFYVEHGLTYQQPRVV